MNAAEAGPLPVAEASGIQVDPGPFQSVGGRASLIVIMVLVCVLFLRYAQELFIPAVLAILIACALTPVVDGLTWLRMPRPVAAGSS